MITPNNTAKTIKTVLIIPSVPKESLIKMVDIINPEFLITLLNLSVKKNENNKSITSTNIKIVKNSSKNILFTSFKCFTISDIEKKFS